MASLLDTLGVSGLQYNALQVLYKQGYSASAAITFLQGTPAAIRRTSGLAVFRALGAQDVAAMYLATIPGSVIPNPANLAPSLTTQKREYSYRFTLGVVDANTGALSTVTRNISTNELISPDVALDYLQAKMAEGSSTSGVVYQSSTLDNITVQGGA